MAIDLPGIFYAVFNVFFGGSGPWYELIFSYALPAGLIFYTLTSLFALFPWRKTTSYVVAAVFALMGSQFGMYKAVQDMINTLFFEPMFGEYGLFMSMFINIMVFALISWLMANFTIGFVMARQAHKGIMEMKLAATHYMRVADNLVKNAEKNE